MLIGRRYGSSCRHSNCLNAASTKKVVLYAGNIGEGQGLEKILPPLASKLNEGFTFKVIGEGVMKEKLIEEIDRNDITNIQFESLVPRDKLIEHYLKSDLLFLHLNTLPAFERSLPSKVFEYAVMGKPIVAGLPGYSKTFVKKNIPHAVVFEPGNISDGVRSIERAKEIKVMKEDLTDFINKFSRKKLSKSLSKSIVECAKLNCAN